MQCSNCQFQNMPGSEMCGRCGTSLALAGATTIDVHPPRAGRWTKKLRRAFPARRAYLGLRDAAERARNVRRRMAFAEQGFFYRLAVPSWPQFHAGERVRGHLYLWTFLALLLPACLFFGTRTGSVLVGLAYSMHTTGALDAVMVNFADGSFADRLARSFVVSIALGIFVYLPAAWGLSYVAAAHVVQRPLGPFEVGDVIMVNSLESARPGRVVLYEMPEYVYTIDDTPHHRIIRRFGGEAIERVIAGPGDLVEFESNRVSVNGSPLPYSPLGGVIGPSSLKVMVPDNSCLILPPAGVEPRPADADAWRHVSVVPLSSVRGVVFARTSPPKKWMLVH